MQNAQKVLGFLARRQRYVIGIVILCLIMVAGLIGVEGFFSITNFWSLLVLAAFLGLASFGQTFCALLGGLDLSIPFVIGTTNIGLASLLAHGQPPVLSIVFIIVFGVVFGCVNGILSFRIQGQSLIISLGSGFAIAGGAQILTSIGSRFGGNVVYGVVPSWLVSFASMNGTIFGFHFPPVVLFWVIISVLTIVFVDNTWFGRNYYAIGGNRIAAARLSVSEFKVWVTAYGVSGGMAAITGIIFLGFSGGGFVGVGDPYLFMTVAAVVMGGTSLLGGWGGYGSTIIGVLVLTTLASLLVGLGLSYAAQQAVIGLLIVPMIVFYARSPHIRMQI